MSEARPHLVAVDGDRTDQGDSNEAPTEKRSGSSSWTLWFLGALALVLGVGWGMSHRQGVALEAELQTTQAQLSRSEARVGALESHLTQVSTQTGALVDGMDGLMGQMRSFASDLQALGSLADQDPQANGNQPPKAATER